MSAEEQEMEAAAVHVDVSPVTTLSPVTPSSNCQLKSKKWSSSSFCSRTSVVEEKPQVAEVFALWIVKYAAQSNNM